MKQKRQGPRPLPIFFPKNKDVMKLPKTSTLVTKKSEIAEVDSEENSTLVSSFITGASVKKVNLLSLNDCQKRVTEYASQCSADGLPIGNQGLCFYLGISPRTFSRIVDGRYPEKKVSPEVRDYFRQVWQGLAANREILAQTNKIPVPIAIFWQKNYDGLEDKTTVQTGPVEENDKMSLKEIQDKIANDMPEEDDDAE